MTSRPPSPATDGSFEAISPGLGFAHLSAAGSGSGARGLPRGEASESAAACRSSCAANPRCGAWLFKPKERKCFLGNCTGTHSACFEALSARQASPPVGGVTRASPHSWVCAPPEVDRAAGGRGGRGKGGGGGRSSRRAAEAAPAGSGGLALLMLGSRARLMFDTVPARLVAPLAAAGVDVRFFAWLENTSMTSAFRGRRPMGSPELGALDDDQLERELRRRVRGAGGRVGEIRIAPRPEVEVPSSALAGRLWRYSEHVKRTVATRMRKEALGLALLEADEAARGSRFEWVLWTREDAHWFAPLELPAMERGVVHGKACGGFGGWNDKVWLMGRAWAGVMLGMYGELHTPRPAQCVLARATPDAAGARGTAAGGEDARGARDFLAAPSVEQFRQRVGALHRVPFRRQPPAALATMDSYFKALAPGDALPETERALAPAGWRLCFPPIYARGCVPPRNQSAVDQMACGERARGEAA